MPDEIDCTPEDDAQCWLCDCGNYIEDGLHCNICQREPPWGCDCSFCSEPPDDEDGEWWEDEGYYEENWGGS